MIRRNRLGFASVLSLLFFAFVVARLGYLQIYCHASLRTRANRNQTRAALNQSPRGAILDRTGAALAMSLQGGSCYADPQFVRKPDEAARVLAPLLQQTPAALKAKLIQRRRFVWLARRLDPDTVKSLRDLKQPGIFVITESKRYYPGEALAAHVLGAVGDGQVGLAGVELAANSWLNGRSTPLLFKEWTFSKKSNPAWETKSDKPPRSLVLTLDRTLQTLVEQELANQMKLSRPRSGTVVVQDPQTGEILAMATAPSFNPNLWGGPQHPGEYGPDTLKNPAVEKVVEPGSTFKVVTAAAALEDGKVDPAENIFCELGSWQMPGRVFRDHERDGWLSFTQVISRSSNIGTAKVARRLGQDRLYSYARAFGFGMPTGCGLPGDGTGILRPTRQWHATSLETISFGQEVGVTALQMANAYSVIANGGWLMEPRLYKGVIDDEGRYREWEPRRPVRRVLSAKTVAQLRTILKNAVDQGTGKAAMIPGLAVAGKTGTAQKIDPVTRLYSDRHYIASFCGFAPAERPRVVITVFLDEPQTNYWGGSEAAPLFARILRHIAPYLHLRPSAYGPLAASRVVPRS